MRISTTFLTAIVCLIPVACGGGDAAATNDSAGGAGPGPITGAGGGTAVPGTGGGTTRPPGTGGGSPSPGVGGGGMIPPGAGGSAGANGGAPQVGMGGQNQGMGGQDQGMGGQSQGDGGAPTLGVDADGDGRPAMAVAPPDPGQPENFLALYDCDDADQTIFRGAPEVCGDTKDNNCDGMTDEAECIPPVGNDVPCQDHEFQGKKYAKCARGNAPLWTQPRARLVCLQKGMDLVAINSREENDFVSSLTNAQTWTSATDVPEPHKDYGATSPTAEKWRWMLNETLFFTGKGTAGKPLTPDIFTQWGITGAIPPQEPNNRVSFGGALSCRDSCQVIRTTQGHSWYDVCCNQQSGDGFCEARE